MVPFLINSNQMLIVSLISFVIALLCWVNEKSKHEVTKKMLERALNARKLWEKAYHAIFNDKR